MASPNLNRFIVAFLTIAVLTSSSIFATSAFFERRTNAATNAPGGTSGGRSAFVESLPERPIDPALALLRTPKGPNATEEVAKLLARRIVDENPLGPLDREGVQTILLPTSTDAVIVDYLKDKSQPFDPLQPSVKEDRIKKVDDSKEHIATYLEDVTRLASRFTETPEAPAEATAEAWLRKNGELFFAATRDLYAIDTPESLLPLHRAVIGLVAAPAEYSNLLLTDPVFAAALQPDFNQALARRMIEVDSAAAALQNSDISLLLPAGSVPLIARLLGVRVAEAQWAVFDPANWAMAFKQFIIWFKDNYEKILVGYLKNTLLKQLTQQTVSWILGEGTPQFVTNWQSFFRNSFSEAAGAILEEVAPELCGGPGAIGASLGLGHMADLIRKVLMPPEVTDYAYYAGCTLDDVIQNVQDFRDDLRNGGWMAYSAVMRPENSFFGSLIQVRELQRRAADASQKADEAQALSGSGMLGQERCDDGSKPTRITVRDLNGKSGAPLVGCEDGSTPKVVSPGQLSNDLLSKSFGSTFDRISAAIDYPALANVLLDAAVTRLMRETTKGILGAIAGSGGSGGGGSGGGTNEPPASNVEAQAKQILENKSRALGDARSAQEALERTIAMLNQVRETCAANEEASAAALEVIEAIDPIGDDLAPKIMALKDQVPALEQFIRDIGKNNSTVASLHGRFGDLPAAQAQASDIGKKRQTIETTYIEAGRIYASCSSDVLTTPPPIPATTTTSTPPFADEP